MLDTWSGFDAVSNTCLVILLFFLVKQGILTFVSIISSNSFKLQQTPNEITSNQLLLILWPKNNVKRFMWMKAETLI
jgi:hypothetical protein